MIQSLEDESDRNMSRGGRNSSTYTDLTQLSPCALVSTSEGLRGLWSGARAPSKLKPEVMSSSLVKAVLAHSDKTAGPEPRCSRSLLHRAACTPLAGGQSSVSDQNYPHLKGKKYLYAILPGVRLEDWYLSHVSVLCQIWSWSQAVVNLA